MNIIRTAINTTILKLEGGFNDIFGNRLNPFYHLGSLTFFFFWIVLVSGIYVFIFFETNVAGAYQSVEYMTHDQWWMAGIMRSLHRYASDAAVITIFIHMIREFGRDRYRGVRWFSWFTGVPTLWLVVVLGISGYWLVWDMLAQYVALATAELIDWIPVLPGSIAFNFLPGQLSDRFFTLMAFLHLAGFPVALVFLLWIHVSRISQIDFNPPKELAIGTMVALLALSLLKPAISHGPADLGQAPTALKLDWFYLNIYPVIDILGPGWAWGLANGITVLLLLLPWLPKRGELAPAEVKLPFCNGCGQCAVDCPYGAVTMQPRTDGRPKTEFEPQMDVSLCTACGICTGSCVSSNPFRMKKQTLETGIEMPWYSADRLRNEADDRLAKLSGSERIILFGCDHGAQISKLEQPGIGIITLPCTGMLPPSLVDYVLKKGADGVFITGCRNGDCYHRFGNTWVDQRVAGLREPHLPSRTDQSKISIFRASDLERSQLEAKVAEFRQTLRNAGRGEGS